MKKNFTILILIFSLLMLTMASVVLYISNNMSSLGEKTLNTYPNLKDYSIILPEGITNLNDLDDDSLNTMVVYVDRTLKTIYLSISNKKINKDSWLFVPETKRTYINISDSTYED